MDKKFFLKEITSLLEIKKTITLEDKIIEYVDLDSLNMLKILAFLDENKIKKKYSDLKSLKAFNDIYKLFL
jgi:hypothetical protein